LVVVVGMNKTNDQAEPTKVERYKKMYSTGLYLVYLITKSVFKQNKNRQEFFWGKISNTNVLDRQQ